jgi:hypothetical protein
MQGIYNFEIHKRSKTQFGSKKEGFFKSKTENLMTPSSRNNQTERTQDAALMAGISQGSSGFERSRGDQYRKLANKEEYFRAFKNLVLFKFMFVTYKRYVLKSCCYLKLEMPQIARQTLKSLTIKDKMIMCDTFKQLIFHAVILEYLAEPDDIKMTSEDLQIMEDIFKFLLTNIMRSSHQNSNMS